MELIGRGGSSKVFKVFERSKGRIYALKKVKLKGQEASATEGYLNEIQLLNQLRGNPYIIQLIDSEVTEEFIMMVLYVLN
jgi:serine/threonine-protein kinase TTK/MPS1